MKNTILDSSTNDYSGNPFFLTSIIDSLEDELLVIDRDYRIIDANKAVLIKHGKTRQEVIGQPCFLISHGLPNICRSPLDSCPVAFVWETGQSARVTHSHVYWNNGKKNTQYVDIIVSPIIDDQGMTVAIVELMRDVTEMKNLELKNSEVRSQLIALNRIAVAVSRSLDLKAILNDALEVTIDIMQANAGIILLWNKENQKLIPGVQKGLSRSRVKLCQLSGESIFLKVIKTGRTAIINNPDELETKLILGLNESVQSLVSLPLRHEDKPLGVLNVCSKEPAKFSPDQVDLLESIASQISIAVENARLHQEVQRNDINRGELLREVYNSHEERQRRLARELHDETSQVLASLNANLEAAIGMLPEGTGKVRQQLSKVQGLSINILDEIHRIIYELRPSLLDDLGLVPAIRWLLENNLQTIGINVKLTTYGTERRLDAQLEITLFRVIQEAITNTARHSRATRCGITIHFYKRSVKVTIKDNGSGFDIKEAQTSKERPRGLGLIGMRERVELLNGRIEISSNPDNKGTEIIIQIPLMEVRSGQNQDSNS